MGATDGPAPTAGNGTLPDATSAKRTPGQVLRESRARDSEVKRARVLEALDEMTANGQKVTFRGLAHAAKVSTWLVYAEGMRERIEEAIKQQAGATQCDAPTSSHATAESVATDLELAKAELRVLRAERGRLKADLTRRREIENERDQLREALKRAEEQLECALQQTRDRGTSQ